MILQNLDPDTPYNIKVTAIYGDGPGGELEGPGRTGTNCSSLTITRVYISALYPICVFLTDPQALDRNRYYTHTHMHTSENLNRPIH